MSFCNDGELLRASFIKFSMHLATQTAAGVPQLYLRIGSSLGEALFPPQTLVTRGTTSWPTCGRIANSIYKHKRFSKDIRQFLTRGGCQSESVLSGVPPLLKQATTSAPGCQGTTTTTSQKQRPELCCRRCCQRCCVGIVIFSTCVRSPSLEWCILELTQRAH